ncbi:MAG: hypothetical protein HY319_30230 [Armatimonadetes bacterium]|nr:hypothetical protein [Armatimonadota bacterium]
MTHRQELDWAPPARCGWCGAVVASGAPRCEACGMDFRHPLLKPLTLLGRGLICAALLVGVLAILQPFAPLVVVLPMAVDYLYLRRQPRPPEETEDDRPAPSRAPKTSRRLRRRSEPGS